jgi:MFS family permease
MTIEAFSEVGEPIDGASSTGEEPWPKPSQGWYAVAIFALALMMGFLDRGVIAYLIHPIELDLKLTDTEIGLITGLASVALYALISLPIARLADVSVRRTIVGIGIATWSLATAFCGLAANFWHLFFARVGVGAGEACNGPPVFSMISDLFPRERLPRAISVLNFGFIFGNGLASLFAGWLIGVFAAIPHLTFPLVGAVKPWQATFIVVGLPGLIVAALMFTVKEPKRRGRISQGTKNLPVSQIVRFFLSNAATYAPMFLGLGFNIIPSVALGAWGAEYFRRSFHWETSQYAIYAGIITMTLAPLGALFGSFLAERFHARGRDDANLRVVFYSFLLNTPVLVALTIAPSPWLALAAFGYIQFVAMWVPGPFNAALQVVTPNEMRAQITALFLYVFNIVGFGLGPSVVATLTDHVFHDPAMLRYSMLWVTAVLMPLATLSIWWGLKAYGASVARAKSWG